MLLISVTSEEINFYNIHYKSYFWSCTCMKVLCFLMLWNFKGQHSLYPLLDSSP